MNIQEIRKTFPALQRKHNGHAVAYFDGPGGTQVPRQVVDAMSDYLYHHNANTHWHYPTSAETDQLLAAARQTVGEFLNASADEIVFGANMTTLTYHLSRGLAREWGPGDEVVVTELDHHGNVAPWQALADERGLTVRVVRLNTETGQLDWSDLERAVISKCRLLAIGAASNALGTITDVKRATALARRAGALVFVDAVHYAPHELIDVRDIGCDFLGCSAYKFYGPHVGMLYIRQELVDRIDIPKLIPAPDQGPERYETGTQNHEGIVGAAAAIDFIAGIGAGNSRRARLASAFQLLHERSAAQVRTLWAALNAEERVRVYGPPPEVKRTSTVSFTMEGLSSTEVAETLAAQGLFLSHGDFYAYTVVERLGLLPEGLVRIGFACYTSDEEVARLIEAIRVLARNSVHV
jgi:cysteine desulfurase family protein (TIGR01976 family)